MSVLCVESARGPPKLQRQAPHPPALRSGASFRPQLRHCSPISMRSDNATAQTGLSRCGCARCDRAMPADTAGAPSNDARKWDTADEDSMRRPNVGTATSSGRFPSPLNTASPHCLAEAFGRFPRRSAPARSRHQPICRNFSSMFRCYASGDGASPLPRAFKFPDLPRPTTAGLFFADAFDLECPLSAVFLASCHICNRRHSILVYC
jgi:hypothetical protein